MTWLFGLDLLRKFWKWILGVGVIALIYLRLEWEKSKTRKLEREVEGRRKKEKIHEAHDEIDKDYTDKLEGVDKADKAEDFNKEWGKGEHY